MLQLSVDWFLYQLLGLDPEAAFAPVLNFFLYDTLKILLLLFSMIFVIGFFRSYLPQEKVKTWLAGRQGSGNVLAALFGALTPFCSCSSIPIFLGFVRVGVPLGVTFSFLVTSPLINEYLVVLMFGFFGWKITLFYVLSGLGIGIVTGLVLGRMNLDRYLVEDMRQDAGANPSESGFKRISDRIRYGWTEAISIVRKIWVWVVVGVGLGALIHNYVPQEAVENIMGRMGYFSVPLATLIGVPMYGSCAAIVPVAVVLFQKGFPLGTALAFMMATAALSLPEAIMLRRAMKLPLILIFFAVTTLGIIFTGYLFNFLQNGVLL